MNQTATQSIEVPQMLVKAWRPRKTAQKKIVEAAVLELVREGELSSGKAAEVLGVTRWEVLDMMSERGIPLANFNPQELARQIKDTRTPLVR